jgi:hypothetical protein
MRADMLAVFYAPVAPVYSQTIPPPTPPPPTAAVTVYVSPSMTNVLLGSTIIGPPAPNPAVYKLQATRPGTTQFNGGAYGELNCGTMWLWQDFGGGSSEVQVQYPPFRVTLPVIRK